MFGYFSIFRGLRIFLAVRDGRGCGPERDHILLHLEHLEPGSLHIRAWGNVADGTTFTRRCQQRQVLFGKRRAYQRKVAVAEFDAVVSGDIYVLAPKNVICALDIWTRHLGCEELVLPLDTGPLMGDRFVETRRTAKGR